MADYQNQLLLGEQQNKKRWMNPRREQDNKDISTQEVVSSPRLGKARVESELEMPDHTETFRPSLSRAQSSLSAAQGTSEDSVMPQRLEMSGESTSHVGLDLRESSPYFAASKDWMKVRTPVDSGIGYQSGNITPPRRSYSRTGLPSTTAPQLLPFLQSKLQQRVSKGYRFHHSSLRLTERSSPGFQQPPPAANLSGSTEDLRPQPKVSQFDNLSPFTVPGSLRRRELMPERRSHHVLYDLHPNLQNNQEFSQPLRRAKKLIREENVPGKGMCYVYDDGSHVQKTIDDESVNTIWRSIKAGKPRKRLAIACLMCRERKIKCEPGDGKCVQCAKSGYECRYSQPTLDTSWGSINGSASTTSPSIDQNIHRHQDHGRSHLPSARVYEYPSPHNEVSDQAMRSPYNVDTCVPSHHNMSTTPIEAQDQSAANTTPLRNSADEVYRIDPANRSNPPRAEKIPTLPEDLVKCYAEESPESTKDDASQVVDRLLTLWTFVDVSAPVTFTEVPDAFQIASPMM